VTEFTEFVRPERLRVHVGEGPFPVDGAWSFEPDGSGTRVHFVAEGQLGGAMRLHEPVVRRTWLGSSRAATGISAATSRVADHRP
jgi:hypothetical protein